MIATSPLGEPIRCPNCDSLMNDGDPCPECDHNSDGDCCCDHCIMQESDEDDDDA